MQMDRGLWAHGRGPSLHESTHQFFFVFIFYLGEQFAIFTLPWDKPSAHTLQFMELTLCPLAALSCFWQVQTYSSFRTSLWGTV